MCNQKKTLLFFFAFLMLSIFGVAQNDINSPYSGFGVGNLSPRTNTALSSMGGVGYALQNPYYINFKNPASYAAFDSLSFIGELAFNITNHKLKTNTEEYKGTVAQLDYLAIGLPVLKVWRTSVGIMPYSDIGYNIIDKHNNTIFGEVTNKYQGSGGIQLLYWGNAFKLCTGLTLGVNLSYLFGRITTMRFAEYELSNSFNTLTHSFRHIDGMQITAGIQYHTTIKEKHQLGIGAVYENAIKVWSKENLLVLKYYESYSPNGYFDTTKVKIGENALKSTMKMPQSAGIGLSYGYKEKLLLGIDFTWQNWKKFSMTETKNAFKNNLVTAIGIQYVPNVLSSKYYNKINFRAGTRISTGYIILNDNPISEFAVSVGLGLPIRTINTRSSINIMFEYSKLGTIKNNLILQNQFKLSFNFILQEKWYQRRKLE
ncbi:MAG: hypothetical protein FWC10_00100 [Lentimicrobiaceae bacterium]|nr:hypothetical protein [Lentimicrobiaceae bacterium]